MKEETLEEAAEEFSKNHSIYSTAQDDVEYGFKHGAKWQQKRMYSEEEAYTIWKAGQEYWKTSGESKTFEEFIEQFKKK